MTFGEIQILAPDAYMCDGYDEAIIGVAEKIGSQPIIAYSQEKIIDILMKRDSMSYNEAVEFFEFNIAGAWTGENTPIFIQTEF